MNNNFISDEPIYKLLQIQSQVYVSINKYFPELSSSYS